MALHAPLKCLQGSRVINRSHIFCVFISAILVERVRLMIDFDHFFPFGLQGTGKDVTSQKRFTRGQIGLETDACDFPLCVRLGSLTLYSHQLIHHVPRPGRSSQGESTGVRDRGDF